MIADLLVIHDDIRMTAQIQTGSERKRAADTGGQLRHFPLHIMGQEPAVGARIGQQLFLIQRLGVFQRLLGCIAEDAVRVPLESSQVVKQRWVLPLLLMLDLFHYSAVPVAGVHHRAGFVQVMDAVRMTHQTAAQIQLHGIEGFRFKMLDSAFTLTEHRQGWRHHPPNGERRTVKERIQPRGVHPDEPVSLRPAESSLIEVVIGGLVLHEVNAFPDRAFFHGGNP